VTQSLQVLQGLHALERPHRLNSRLNSPRDSQLLHGEQVGWGQHSTFVTVQGVGQQDFELNRALIRSQREGFSQQLLGHGCGQAGLHPQSLPIQLFIRANSPGRSQDEEQVWGQSHAPHGAGYEPAARAVVRSRKAVFTRVVLLTCGFARAAAPSPACTPCPLKPPLLLGRRSLLGSTILDRRIPLLDLSSFARN
jgi:hypothetical protein